MTRDGLTTRWRAIALALLALAAAMLAALTVQAREADADVKASQFKKGSCAPLDLAFVVDTTGSMGPAIDNVRAGLDRIVSEAVTVAGGNLRLEVMDFSDDVFVREPFALNNQDRAKAAIRALTLQGGGNLPEASDEALNTAINGLPASARPGGDQTGDAVPFRTGEKIAVLITDALPGGFNDRHTSADKANARRVAEDARAKGIRISSIFVPTGGRNPEIEKIMKQYATISRGQYRMTKQNGSGTATAIDATIASCAGKISRKKKLKVTPTPKQRQQGRRCFSFKVTSRGKAVSKATVKLVGKRAKTNRRGRATICSTFGRVGARGVRASKSGFTADTASVFITRRPRFTG